MAGEKRKRLLGLADGELETEMCVAALMYKPWCGNVNLNPAHINTASTCPCLLIKGRGRVSETYRMQLDTLSSNIWFVWQKNCIKE